MLPCKSEVCPSGPSCSQLHVMSSMPYYKQRFILYNCRIDDQYVIKVGDFGLTEDIYSKNYFRETAGESVKLPIKWMALESLFERIFSEKTDVVSVWKMGKNESQ